MHSYDVTGYPDIAKQDLEFFAKSQKPDGNFLSQEQQYDGWGEAVWGYSQHYRITHDKAFAEWALPQIDRAVDWLKTARAADPLHIMPASDVRDNEFVPGHLTGYNFLALSGLKLAIQMANETGHADLAQSWQPEYDDYRAAFLEGARRTGRSAQRLHSARARRPEGRLRLGQPARRASPSPRSIPTIPASPRPSKPPRPNTTKAS